MACRFIVSVGVTLMLASALRADPPTEDEPAAQDDQTADAGPANLIANGDFELGESSPGGWQPVDGLTAFWINDRDPHRGRVLRIDTDVRQLQAFDRWKAMRGATVEPAPAKQATIEPKADTLANLDGVAYYSDPIAVEPGKQYVLSLAVRGPPLRVRLVGYADVPDATIGGEDAEFLRFLAESPAAATDSLSNSKSPLQKPIWRGEMRAGGSNKWTVYSRADKPFQPTKVIPQVRFVRVLLLPAWPPSQYFVDEVRLFEYRPR